MPRPIFANKSPKQPFSLKEIFGQFRLWLYNPTGNPVKWLADTAGMTRTREFEPYTFQVTETVAATDDTVYTVPASTVSVVEIEVTNNSSSAATCTLHAVEGGGATGVSNRILNAVSLPANSIPIRLGPYALDATGFMSALAGTADAITIHLFIKEYGTGDAVAL